MGSLISDIVIPIAIAGVMFAIAIPILFIFPYDWYDARKRKNINILHQSERSRRIRERHYIGGRIYISQNARRSGGLDDIFDSVQELFDENTVH